MYWSWFEAFLYLLIGDGGGVALKGQYLHITVVIWGLFDSKVVTHYNCCLDPLWKHITYIVDTLVLYFFVHSSCVIPSNIPFVIQRDVLVCEQSDRRRDSLQTYITAVGRCFLWRIRTPKAFVRRNSNSDSTSNRYVTCFWLHAQVYWSFCCISEYNQKRAVNLEYYWRVISEQSGESPLICLALAWQRQDVRLLSWQTDLCSYNNWVDPSTSRDLYNNQQPQTLHWFPDLSLVSGSSFKQALQFSVLSIGKVRISRITSWICSTCLRDTNVASKVQLYGITSYVRSGKFLTFDFYASDMDFLWRLDRSSQTQ